MKSQIAGQIAYLQEFTSLGNWKLKLFLRRRQISSKISEITSSSLLYNLFNFVVSAIAAKLVFEAAGYSEVQKVVTDKTTFYGISFSFLIIIAGILFYAKHRMEKKKEEGFKKINEIMNSSFQIIYSAIIKKMEHIREAENKTKVKKFLREINEIELYKFLTQSLWEFLSEIFGESVEIKIDVYRYNNSSGNQEGSTLSPVTSTFINGAYAVDFSYTFSVKSKRTEFDSLAEFSFRRCRVGYIHDVQFISRCLKGITNEKYKRRIVDKLNFYFHEHDSTEGFETGTILCFPLKNDSVSFGVLSISFKQSDIEGLIKQHGININDFKRSISTFIDKYTQFAIEMSNGIKNVIEKIN